MQTEPTDQAGPAEAGLDAAPTVDPEHVGLRDAIEGIALTRNVLAVVAAAIAYSLIVAWRDGIHVDQPFAGSLLSIGLIVILASLGVWGARGHRDLPDALGPFLLVLAVLEVAMLAAFPGSADELVVGSGGTVEAAQNRASFARGSLAALVASFAAYRLARHTWTQIALVGSLIALVSIVASGRGDEGTAVGAAFVIVIGAGGAVATWAGAFGPDRSGYLIAGLTGLVGTTILSELAPLAAGLLGTAIVVAFIIGAIRMADATYLPIIGWGSLFTLPPLLVPRVGFRAGLGTSLLLLALFLALPSFLLSLRQAAERPRTGGSSLTVVAAASVGALLGAGAGGLSVQVFGVATLLAVVVLLGLGAHRWGSVLLAVVLLLRAGTTGTGDGSATYVGPIVLLGVILTLLLGELQRGRLTARLVRLAAGIRRAPDAPVRGAV